MNCDDARVSGYAASAWTDFFVAEAGASAALTGLLFVAVSINLEYILKYPQLPGRAMETLAFFLNVLLVATLGLIPDQRAALLGVEIIVVSGVVWFAVVRASLQPRAPDEWASHYRLRIVLSQVATVPFLICGLSLLVGTGGGLYWLGPAVVLAFAVAITNAWVLMVEIRR